MPDLWLGPEPDHRGREVFGVVGDQGVLFVDQVHSLGRDPRDDRGYAERHALVHLPLDPGPVADRCDREPGLIKEMPDLRNVAQDLDVWAREVKDLRSRVGANHLEDRFGIRALTKGKISLAK